MIEVKQAVIRYLITKPPGQRSSNDHSCNIAGYANQAFLFLLRKGTYEKHVVIIRARTP
jgi:hypothetical protein